jgi:RHS repeat-associated protein
MNVGKSGNEIRYAERKHGRISRRGAVGRWLAAGLLVCLASLTGRAYAQTFTLSTNGAPVSVLPGGPVIEVGITITTSGGFAAEVPLHASNVPTGVAVDIPPCWQYSSPASGSTCWLTVSAASTAPGGGYSITITGTGGGVTSSTTFGLFVDNFSISASPASLSMTQGSSATSTIATSVPGSFPGMNTINLTASGQPAGVTPTFSSSLGPYNGSTSTLTLVVASTTTPGTYPITVTGTMSGSSTSAGSGSLTRTTTVTIVMPTPTPTISVASSGSPSTYGSPVTFTATVTSGDANTVTFYNGGTSLGTATPSSSGTATLTTSSLPRGSDSITASIAAGVGYTGATSSAITQTVIQATPTVSAWPTASAIAYGQTLASSTLSGGTASVGGTFAWTTPSTAPGAGTPSESVTFTPSSTANYNTVSGTANVTVSAATPTISISSLPSSASYGGSFTATYSYSGNGSPTETVASSTTSVCTVSGNTVSYVGVGTCSLTASATATTDYAAVTGSAQSFTVSPATPTITWNTPAPISSGTPLMETQLNATANVPGTFVYTPSYGTIITAAQTLSVTFTPTDTNHYTTATATVPITLRTGANADTGTVTLEVNPGTGYVTVATYHYGATDTPSSVAEGLAAAASSPLVRVKAVDDALYIEAIATGSTTNYAYNLSSTNVNPTLFPEPSFVPAAIGGGLDGGADAQSAGTGATVYSFAGSYDGVGNLTGYTDSVMGTWSMLSSNGTSGYDSLNRLSAATQTPVSGAAQSFCWTYDSFGNRTNQAISNMPFTNAAGATTCQLAGSANLVANTWANYNANNQFTATSQAPGGVSYDVAGNVLNDGQNQYLYDAEGRICAVASSPVPSMTVMTGYLYDADGTRVAKGRISTWSCDPGANGFQTTNDYILGPSGEQVTEMGMGGTSNGATTSGLAWQHTNVYAAGSLIATYDNDGLHFYLNDPLGTRRAQTDYAGVLEQTCSSLPFGDGLVCTGSTTYPTEHHFTGKERDTESGNDYFGARYYASSMGRWMSPDFSESPVGIPYGDIENPQSFNLYGYVFNNPLKNRDPDGHACDPDYMTADVNGDTVVHAGACHLDWWDLPGHAWVGLANLMMARTGKQAATGARQMFYAYSIGVPLAGVGVGMTAAGGLTTLGLGTAAAGGTVQGLYGAVSVAALQQAATSGGETITVVTNLDAAPAAGRALSVATGDGAQSLASQASGSTQYVAQIPKALVNLMEQKGLAIRSYTSMGGTTAQEIRFMPQATQFITQFFK